MYLISYNFVNVIPKSSKIFPVQHVDLINMIFALRISNDNNNNNNKHLKNSISKAFE